MKRLCCLLLAVLLVFSLGACAGQSAEEERIQRVMTCALTCPDEELVSLLEDNVIYLGEGSPQPDAELLEKRQQAEKAYAEYLKTVFTTDDLTESFQETFCETGYAAVTYPSVCAQMGMSISVESVAVELISESSRRYGYSAEVVITGPDGEETPYTQEGKVQLSEDGRISYIDVTALMELSDIVVRIANGME